MKLFQLPDNQTQVNNFSFEIKIMNDNESDQVRA